jgi:hypothetical protein
METLPVGLARTPEPVAPVRTEQQRATALAIAARPEFAYCCSNPFTPDVDYTRPFMFLWYDTSERLHATRIGKRGDVLREVVTG